MSKTKIEWSEQVWNPIVGCSLASPGCTHCYAMNMAARLDRIGVEHYKGLTKPSKAGPVWTGKVALAPEIVLSAPLKRKKATTYFVNSMGDLFHEGITESVIDRIFSIMAMTPQHTYQILTKRTKRMREYLSTKDRVWRVFASVRYYIDNEFREGSRFEDDETPFEWPLTNVWVGSSIEDQKRADERRHDLEYLAFQGWNTFVSYEPALGPVDWTGWSFLRWLVSGGESGTNARPTHPDWHRAARDFCQTQGHNIPYFFKQWGEWGPYDRGKTDGTTLETPHSLDEPMQKFGKKLAGRTLDGVIWDQMPEIKGIR